LIPVLKKIIFFISAEEILSLGIAVESPAIRTEWLAYLHGDRRATADLSTPLRFAQDDNAFAVVTVPPANRP
jgi:hypothetical protein